MKADEWIEFFLKRRLKDITDGGKVYLWNQYCDLDKRPGDAILQNDNGDYYYLDGYCNEVRFESIEECSVYDEDALVKHIVDGNAWQYEFPFDEQAIDDYFLLRY